MATNTTLRLILGDQLNHQHSWFTNVDDQVIYTLMEIRSETDYVVHHIQKVAAFFLSMRQFAEALKAAGHRVHYIAFDSDENKHSFIENIRQLIAQYEVNEIGYQLPDEYRLDVELKSLAEELSQSTEFDEVSVNKVDTEHFMTTRNQLTDFFKGKKRYTMEYFYRDMRKRFNILVDSENKPTGGEWNYDQDNRNKIPANVGIPAPLYFEEEVEGIVTMLKEAGVKTLGTVNASEWIWPVTRAQALEQLKDFTKTRLSLFGTYQDAMTERNPFLFHARISYALNVKLISPQEVIDHVVDYYNRNKEEITINQVEGFIRQVIGWREYMRGVYWAHMPEYAELNALSHSGELPAWFWTGETKMNCLKHSIKQSLATAYAHHIQRLMVTGNFALLLGVHPDEVDAWYLGIYIDAIEWVEITNTRGMSQFADGGIVGTKPYISSANYINKMSDYCKGCHYDYKLRHGPNACPFNSLYWAFVDRHRETLASNGRMGQMVRLWDKMASQEQEATLKQADFYLENRHSL